MAPPPPRDGAAQKFYEQNIAGWQGESLILPTRKVFDIHGLGSGFRNYGGFLWPKLVEMILVLVVAGKNLKSVAWGRNLKTTDNPKPIMITV
jgi:hypothetical protein